jgi:hypothetical protein
MLLHLHCHSMAASGRGRMGARSKLADIIELATIYRTTMHYRGRGQILKARQALTATVVPN